eukprot:4749-Heterococcus_DN1.PRE.1
MPISVVHAATICISMYLHQLNCVTAADLYARIRNLACWCCLLNSSDTITAMQMSVRSVKAQTKGRTPT